jgi:hypothetical protein
MYKYILEQAGNINWMALFALLTFCFIFGTSIILVLRRNKAHIDHMSSLPLEDTTVSQEKMEAVPK